MPYSASTIGKAPNVSVSTASTPTSKKLRCSSAMTAGPGDGQDLVAALQGGATEVVGAQVARLEVGAGGAVEDDDPVAQSVEEGTHDQIRLPEGL